VLPRDFHFAPVANGEFWTTLRESGGTFGESNPCEGNRACHNLLAIARLKDGVSVPTALAAMKSIAQQLETQYPKSNRGQGANVALLDDVVVGNVRPILLALLSAAGLLLLMACVNVTSLVLARSDSRKREIAMRNALGASRARLVRQFATEAAILATLGAPISANLRIEASGYASVQQGRRRCSAIVQ
jgi:ABC-type antimicrobial peptide transport system permease subunit